MKKVLIAEDEASIREFIVINLKRSGYEVIEAADGQEAVDKYDESGGDIDIALLDIMMPRLDGLEVCKYLREKSATLGIIMLTAKAQEIDKVTGLLVGADDYVIKPFSPSELMARVDAVYRRVNVNKEIADKSKMGEDTIKTGDFLLNIRDRTLEKNGEKVELTDVEFKIMECFMRNPGKPVARMEMLAGVWGSDYFGDDKVVDVNIRRLRMKVEEDPSEPEHIVTVWGSGYKWVSSAEE